VPKFLKPFVFGFVKLKFPFQLFYKIFMPILFKKIIKYSSKLFQKNPPKIFTVFRHLFLIFYRFSFATFLFLLFLKNQLCCFYFVLLYYQGAATTRVPASQVVEEAHAGWRLGHWLHVRTCRRSTGRGPPSGRP
jgi:hypothetical protein